MDSKSTNQWEQRLGKGPYWLKLTKEEHGLSASWRLDARQKPPRASKRDSAIPLFDISPQHPLLTLTLGEESFPLLIDQWSMQSGGRYVLSGQRKLGAIGQRVAAWTADLDIRSVDSLVLFDLDVKVRLSGAPRGGCGLRFSVAVPFFQPYVKQYPLALRRGDQATVVWSEEAGCALSFVAPPETQSDREPWNPGVLGCVVAPLSDSGRGSIACSLAIGPAKSSGQAHGILTEHYALSRSVALPEVEPWGMSMREASSHAIALITDKGAYDVKGIERVYLRPPIWRMELGYGNRPSYFAGFPDFPVDAARAMIDWHDLTADEPAKRLAALAARGVATDFAVMACAGHCHSNKGAFWDRQTLQAEGILPCYSNAYGEDNHSIVSCSRIARALFEMFGRTGDAFFLQSALNTCHWLMLKQNGDGYYDGYKVHGRTGRIFGGHGRLAGAEAIRPLVMAFRATGNEVYIKSAWKIADHLIYVNLPEMAAPPLFAQPAPRPYKNPQPMIDSPVAVASVICALHDLDAEAPNKRLREAMHLAGAWLRAFTFDPTTEPDLNYDGMSAGLYECAQAAILMFGIERDTEFLHLGLSAIRSIPAESRISWRSVQAFLMAHLSLAGLLPGGQIDVANRTATIDWRRYGLDNATNSYVSVSSADNTEPVAVDFLPLVCRQDDHMLLVALSDAPVEKIRITHNGRSPVVCDLVSKELISGPPSLHKLPFESQQRYGLFSIAP